MKQLKFDIILNVLIALVVYKILDSLFLDKMTAKMLKKGESYEVSDYEDYDDDDELDDEI